MTFAHPERLAVTLAAVVVFAMVYRRMERGAVRQALTYSSLAFATRAMQPRRWPAVALQAALLVGVAALATAPAAPRVAMRVPVKDGTVILCIDTSGSMRARDLAPSRAGASQAAAEAFVDAMPHGARVGIVTFATEAALLQAPTDDLDAVRAALARMPPPNGATAIGDALHLAAQQLPAHGSRAIVVMTDGVNNRGVDPVNSAREAVQHGITIHAVGVGTNGSGQLIPGTTEPADLDEDTLRAIAELGHGTYAAAGDAGTLAATFKRLALATAWEPRRVDAGTLFAVAGGTLVVIAFLCGFGIGRFP